MIHLFVRITDIRSLPPLNALRCFEAAARLNSFSRAAEELCVTPSAVSHQVKSLEAFLNIKLFLREKRRVYLTNCGEKYLQGIAHAFDEIDIATRRLVASPNMAAVNISVAPVFLTRWLVPRIAEFQQQHPNVELRLSASNGLVDFHQSDTDMAIYFGKGDWDGVDCHFLRGVILTPVCSPGLLDSEKSLRSPKDLSHHTLIKVSSRPWEWEYFLQQAGVRDSETGRSLAFSSTSLATGAAMEGLGIALADRFLVERELQYGQLVIPFDLVMDTHRAFYLVNPQGRSLTHGMKVFSDWLIRRIADLALE